jgi:hypothetical protein
MKKFLILDPLLASPFPGGGTVPSPGKGRVRVGSFCGLLFSILISFCAFAQEDSSAESTNIATPALTEAPAEKKPAEKKMVSEANISLRTTVTGNQEQPLVMYILPWQSPDSPEFDLEMQSSQADAVFGHIEREELNRQLDSAGELDEEEN